MTVGRGYTRPAHIYHLPTGASNDSKELSRVTQEMDLGDVIDSDLHFIIICCKNKKLFKLQSHLDLRKYCFTVRVVSEWDSLPTDVVNAPSIDAFKERLDRFWSSQEVRLNYKTEFDL